MHSGHLRTLSVRDETRPTVHFEPVWAREVALRQSNFEYVTKTVADGACYIVELKYCACLCDGGGVGDRRAVDGGF